MKNKTQQLNEVARMQQLAGIHEIKINKPFEKIINISDDIGEGYNFHSYNNEFIQKIVGKNIHTYVDIYKNTFVLWGLTHEEADSLELALNQMGIEFSIKNYKGDIGIKIPINRLNII